MDIVNWRPLPEMRLYTPDARYVHPAWQRKFFIECDDGSNGDIFADVTEENLMVPKFAVHNSAADALNQLGKEVEAAHRKLLTTRSHD